MSDPPGDSGVTNRALVQSLRSWQLAGLTHIPRAEAPEAVLQAGDDAEPTSVATNAHANEGATSSERSESSPPPANDQTPMPEPSAAADDKSSADERQQRLFKLAAQVTKCTRCEALAATRTQTVFGVGNPDARVMFVGEAPGADEDRQGEPFVGRAGKLLNKIIVACGWTREEIYICNILRCRPPGNRNPTEEEASSCREYLDGQIGIVDPDYIVCWGSVAAKNLLNTDESIGRMREKWFNYGRAKVMCTYHPSYLLRNPAAKKPVWEDMLRLLAAMGLESPQ